MADTADRRVGTCLSCGTVAVLVNYSLTAHGEEGYLGRHTRPGTRAGSKCRGSFGGWAERSRAHTDVVV